MATPAAPTGADVATYLGLAGDPDAEVDAEGRLPVVAAFVRGYCRGRGHTEDGTPYPDVRAVIIAATAREMNVSPGVLREEAGSHSVLFAGNALDFTLRELLILNGHRRRAA